jgi:hypothetical protein
MGKDFGGKGQNFLWTDVEEFNDPPQRLEKAVFFYVTLAKRHPKIKSSN